jgi:thioredoxin-related protein
MKRGSALLLAALLLVAAACRQRDDIWFDGDFSAATTLAKESGSLVMLVFETDWCIWCDRLEKETLADPDVRSALAGIVALKLDAERAGERLARYGVDSIRRSCSRMATAEEIGIASAVTPPAQFSRREPEDPGRRHLRG